MNKVILGDCLEAMRTMPDNSVDSIVTDPPYGLSFMGKKWDYEVPSVAIWEECLRVLKPGGYVLAFAGTRTQHRMAVNIEDAGFEIRDMIAWCYASGFPKSHNIGKAVDKLQGNEREVTETKIKKAGDMSSGNFGKGGDYADIEIDITKGTSPYEGWGTALKPSYEPITVARKPFKGTVAQNVLEWGTGGINVDGCRVESGGTHSSSPRAGNGAGFVAHNKPGRKYGNGMGGIISQPHTKGRFPANLIHDGSDEVVGLFPETKSGKAGLSGFGRKSTIGGDGKYSGGVGMPTYNYGDKGSAARFFYCAKASKSERNAGVEGGNTHPTVKPVNLMRYLVRLVTPKGGLVLDPFGGSGSTGVACVLEGFNSILCEMDADSVKTARERIEHHRTKPEQKTLF